MSNLETKTCLEQTVLVVEDDPYIRDILINFLEIWGYHVVVAEDAGEAIGMSETLGKPDYLLCDLNLSRDMDGLEVVSAFRCNGGTEDTRAILMTGNPSLLQGEGIVCEVLSKPFGSEQLRQALSGVPASP